MSEILFTCMIDPQDLRLSDFQSRHHVGVRAQRLVWDDAWDALLRIALYNEGPDVSEIGSTWLGTLVEMDALRPLTSRDMTSIGDRAGFFPAAWQGVMMPGDRQIWAIPFLTDTRVIYYRRGELERAGIAEATAFETPALLVDTLAHLQARGVEIPWAIPTRGPDVLHNLAPWVWGSGGRFRASDGRRMLLGEPQALAGTQVFFDLHRFLSPAARTLDTAGTDTLFRQGRAAAVVSGPWLLGLLTQDATILSDVGIAPVPGVPIVGGTNLVTWRHAQSERTIFQFIRYLTAPTFQQQCFSATGLLPACAAVLDAQPFAGDPRYQAFATSLKRGRALQASYRWAAVEQRLVNLLSRLWRDLAENPQLDLENEIAERIAALIQNLERTVLATW